MNLNPNIVFIFYLRSSPRFCARLHIIVRILTAVFKYNKFFQHVTLPSYFNPLSIKPLLPVTSDDIIRISNPTIYWTSAARKPIAVAMKGSTELILTQRCSVKTQLHGKSKVKGGADDKPGSSPHLF